MNTPLVDPPLSDAEVPLWNFFYLSACGTPADPTIHWGTDVDVAAMKDYLRQVNETSSVLITPAHILLKAVACALQQHPQFNCRTMRGRVYRFKEINLLVPIQKRRPAEADVVLLEQVDRLSLADIATQMWQHMRDAARGEFIGDRNPPIYMRLPRRILYWIFPLHQLSVNRINLPAYEHNKRQRTAAALVNLLAFDGASPVRSFKPSRFPNDSCLTNVTLGGDRPTPVAQNDDVIVRPVAPLFVRSDHRIVDAFQIARFATTIRELISEPWRMEADGEADCETAPSSALATVSDSC